MNKSLFSALGGRRMMNESAAPAQTPMTAPAQTPIADPPAATMNMTAHMTEMDDQIKRMQVLHAKMASATTPAARERLVDEQRAVMQEGMGMMKPMMQGGGIPSHDMMGGDMMGQKATPGAAPDPKMKAMMEKHMGMMQMMQKRVDMMQTMMQTMLDQQEMINSSMSMATTPKK